MYREVKVDGLTLIPLRNGGALVASRSQPGVWHATRVNGCDCPSWTYRSRACAHMRALNDWLRLRDDGEHVSFGEWRERRAS